MGTADIVAIMLVSIILSVLVSREMLGHRIRKLESMVEYLEKVINRIDTKH